MQDDLPLKLVCSMPSAVIHTCGAHTVIQHRASNWYGQMNPTVFRTENHICYLFSYLFGFLFTQNFPKCFSACRITLNFKRDLGLKILIWQKMHIFWLRHCIGESLSTYAVAYFLRFIAANLSLTQFVTWLKPRYWVYRIAYFSFASANTRSIVSFCRSYKALYSGVCLMSSALSR